MSVCWSYRLLARTAVEVSGCRGSGNARWRLLADSLIRPMCSGSNTPSTSAAADKPLVRPVSKQTKPKSKPAKEDPARANILVGNVRACQEYCLSLKDLDGLAKQVRRSPFHGEPPHVMYLLTDVEQRAIEVHGSREALKKVQDIQKAIRSEVIQNAVFDHGRATGKFPPSRIVLPDAGTASAATASSKRTRDTRGPRVEGLFGSSSGRVVLLAVGINATTCCVKLVGWVYTGSSSMFAETVHSLADTLNQLILALGVHHSSRKADADHPYGYTNARYVASLISGVGIFFFGTGLSVYHGIHALLYPQPMEPLLWAFLILGGALFTEGSCLTVAWNELSNKSKSLGMSRMRYVYQGEDPALNVVLCEDLAAILGVMIAAGSMGLSAVLGSHIPDALGSLAIGGLLGLVAAFLIKTNVHHLVGRSIPYQEKAQIIKELEKDVMILSVQDVKATELGSSRIRFKAEIDFDGRNITRAYLQDQQNLEKLFDEVKGFNSPSELERFLLAHGEGIVDRLGVEVDRIEADVMKRHPEVRHVDLESL